MSRWGLVCTCESACDKSRNSRPPVLCSCVCVCVYVCQIQVRAHLEDLRAVLSRDDVPPDLRLSLQGGFKGCVCGGCKDCVCGGSRAILYRNDVPPHLRLSLSKCKGLWPYSNVSPTCLQRVSNASTCQGLVTSALHTSLSVSTPVVVSLSLRLRLEFWGSVSLSLCVCLRWRILLTGKSGRGGNISRSGLPLPQPLIPSLSISLCHYLSHTSPSPSLSVAPFVLFLQE